MCGRASREDAAAERIPIHRPKPSSRPERLRFCVATRWRSPVFAGIRRRLRSVVTCIDDHWRTWTDVVLLPDTEEVTGSIPVSPTMFVQVSGVCPTWGRAASCILGWV